ncbi:MAG: ATPase P, partial [Planctomycetaceae bacterium]
MLTIEIPGSDSLRLEKLVMDYNGTLAIDGKLLPGVGMRLRELAETLELHVVTADTFGRVREAVAELPCRLHVLEPGRQDQAKRAYLMQLGADRTAAIGNGRNDRQMVEGSALGIALIAGEGAFPATLMAADVICTDICNALDLLIHPLRL